MKDVATLICSHYVTRLIVSDLLCCFYRILFLYFRCMNIKSLLGTALFTLIFMTDTKAMAPKTSINYTLSFPEAQAHYVDVLMTVSENTKPFLDIKMPVWTPGSYLIREFAKNVEGFSVEGKAGKKLSAEKITKNTWRIQTAAQSTINIHYRVYAFEISVRTSFIDAAHGFISTSGVFMYPAGKLKEPSTVTIKPYKGWKTVSTGLEPVGNDPFVRYAPNFDILFDSPIEIGTQQVFNFEAAGVKHEVAMVGREVKFDADRLKKDMAKIVENETAVFGENPNKRYVFIVHHYAKGGGGLEHLNSTVLGASRNAYQTEKGYLGFLGLVAHEYFHLWNVKRLRPKALGPFNYDVENYTANLWVAEGFTAYYDNLMVHRSGFHTAEEYLNVLATGITRVENTPGNRIQPLAEASFDSWIKFYRPNENSANSGISYYEKGSLIGMMMDLEIIHATKGQKSLDDAMKAAYEQYYKKLGRGYTNAEFKAVIEKTAGKNMDDFYQKYIYTTAPVNYNQYLGYAGYQLTDKNKGQNKPALGVKLTPVNGQYIVSTVYRGTSAWDDGINVNDVLVSIDGDSFSNIESAMAAHKTGDKIKVSVLRDGLPMELNVTLKKDDNVDFTIEKMANPTAEQQVVAGKWLKVKS